MFSKGQKYYADWRDEDGNRRRKSFTSARAALTFEAEQKALTHPKTTARGPHSPNSYAPNTSAKRRTPARTPTRQPKHSLPTLVPSRPTNSKPVRSQR